MLRDFLIREEILADVPVTATAMSGLIADYDRWLASYFALKNSARGDPASGLD
jgi:hypothetical protein